jgi:hypothetical protein
VTRSHVALALVVALLATAVRMPLLTRQGLWADEVFSLAIATGHSLEHPAAAADPAEGDFVEPPGPVSAAELTAYLRHDDPPCGPARVVRATRLSDTSPPLYYLFLWAWTRALGTSDAALRGFSLACFAASLWVGALLARRVAGDAAVVPALLLLGFNPVWIYYSTEGRMYALLVLLVLGSALATLTMRARPLPARLAAWVAASVAGFLTHYFFAFVWLSLALFLLASPGRVPRARLVAAGGAVGLAILPWYAGLGASLARWRITAGWLEVPPEGFRRGWATLELLRVPLGGGDLAAWGERAHVALAALVVLGVLLAAGAWRARGRAFRGARAMLWLWLLAAWLGPLAFDSALGTYTAGYMRYALPWVPAGLLLAAGAAALLRPAPRALLLVALCSLWTLQTREMLQKRSRSWCPLREAAAAVSGFPADEVVLVHSIPSGVLGVARYLEGDAPVAAWIGQLGARRVPGSLPELLAGRRAVHLVRVHEVGEPALEESWLRAHATLLREGHIESARVAHFTAAGAPSF